jgi:hypothetical protein
MVCYFESIHGKNGSDNYSILSTRKCFKDAILVWVVGQDLSKGSYCQEVYT